MVPELVVLDTHRNLPAHINSDLLTTCKPGWSYNQQAAYQIFNALVDLQGRLPLPDLPDGRRLPRAAARHVRRLPSHRPDALDWTDARRTVSLRSRSATLLNNYA